MFVLGQVTLATNYWGTFYLTHLLLPMLGEAPNARIIFTTSLSEVHGDIDWSDLQYVFPFSSFCLPVLCEEQAVAHLLALSF
jgi:hypothetical protein